MLVRKHGLQANRHGPPDAKDGWKCGCQGNKQLDFRG